MFEQPGSSEQRSVGLREMEVAARLDSSVLGLSFY